MKSKLELNRYFTIWLSLFVLLAFLAANFSEAIAKSTKIVQVPATARWVNTSMRLTAGQKVTIQAKGIASTLKTEPTAKSGPKGQKYICARQPDAPPPCAMNYARYGALVAKIGTGTPFYIGPKKTFTATSSGLLYLAVNDNLKWYSDNAGGFTVTINLP